ncbi:hypothetical protein [Halomonas alimentaria]|nr:hypothetical protein [Halomonas alimentaria]
MIASATHPFRHHAACGRAESACVAACGFWYGYFMTGVPAAMS